MREMMLSKKKKKHSETLFMCSLHDPHKNEVVRVLQHNKTMFQFFLLSREVCDRNKSRGSEGTMSHIPQEKGK